MTEDSIDKIIVDYIRAAQTSYGVEYEEILDTFGEYFEREDFDDLLERLVSEGQIYEPTPRYYKYRR